MADFGDISSSITLGASESVRRNASDTDFEAFTPGAGGGVARSGSTTDGHIAVWDGNDADSIKDGGTPGGGASHAYFDQLCALLEPDAIEEPQYGAFSYVVASNETKYLLLAWNCQISSAGRLEIRTPLGPPYVLPLRGVTLQGVSASPHSEAVIVDPTLPTYADSWTTYYDRMLQITTLPTKYIAVVNYNSHYPFLPGPYGNIITRVTSFNFAWVALEDSYFGGAGWPLHMERGDTGSTDYFRFGEPLMIPINKGIVSAVMSGDSGGTGTPLGSVMHVILPATWSAVTDPLSYTFRDDFMGAALDASTIWTRAQNSAGDVDIDAKWQWCKLKGNGASWGSAGAYTQSSFARSGQPTMLIDFYMPVTGNSFGFIMGLSDGGGQSYANFAHGILVQTNGTFIAFEDANNRGAVGSGFTLGAIYRLRIRALSGGGATYEIQGGSQYGTVGGASWTDITPGTSSSAVANLHAAFAAAGEGDNYVGDVRVY